MQTDCESEWSCVLSLLAAYGVSSRRETFAANRHYARSRPTAYEERQRSRTQEDRDKYLLTDTKKETMAISEQHRVYRKGETSRYTLRATQN